MSEICKKCQQIICECENICPVCNNNITSKKCRCDFDEQMEQWLRDMRNDALRNSTKNFGNKKADRETKTFKINSNQNRNRFSN